MLSAAQHRIPVVAPDIVGEYGRAWRSKLEEVRKIVMRWAPRIAAVIKKRDNVLRTLTIYKPRRPLLHERG